MVRPLALLKLISEAKSRESGAASVEGLEAVSGPKSQLVMLLASLAVF